MRISRKINIIINWLLNETLPPFIRDSKWLMMPLFWLMFGKRAALFYDFHKRIYTMTDTEFSALNADIQPAAIARATDLNNACIVFIQKHILGKNILEVGCGKGYLSQLLSHTYQVTGVDIALPQEVKNQTDFKAQECMAEVLPFADRSFDTVICTHTLEHVRDIQKALTSLRRVCGKRLIIVVPCERPYFYTFNLHIHFFPYAFSLLAITGVRSGQSLQKIGGDWVYIEENK